MDALDSLDIGDRIKNFEFPLPGGRYLPFDVLTLSGKPVVLLVASCDGGEAEVVELGGTQLNGEIAGVGHRGGGELGSLRDQGGGVGVARRAREQLQLELRSVQGLADVVVQHLGQPVSLVLLGPQQLRGQLFEPLQIERALVKGFRWAFAADETYRNAALAILDEDPNLDLFAVYFNGIDVMGHRFWKYRDPAKQPALPSADVASFAGVLDAYYAYIDASIGEILARRKPGDTVLVISDHGFEDGNHKGGPDGIFIAAGANLDADATLGEVRLIDVAPTILALLGLPGAADFDGRVLTEAFTPGWREAYRSSRWRATTPRTGSRRRRSRPGRTTS